MGTAEGLMYLINHVFLPPKVPQKDDGDLATDRQLLKGCSAALKSYQNHDISSEERTKWATCSHMVDNMLETHDMSGDMSPKKIEARFREMTIGGLLSIIEPRLIAANL